ncbi:hypothetical protein ABIC28_000097 [Rhodococcus sp. PvR044]|jgi:hypothetical protein|uniref:hypothetical protein n=1 Tax=Rhodococcus TaxID=1827 RepID=UPI000BD67DD3|nr:MULTISPECIES: hypothetical protein [Rhodococcus]MBP1162566.1 hypothetical protein [Rhodococcus sp. PvR099]MCZ4555251.1 hypothetical protein [Rhodococcus maanshanensis]PTR43931.1 hypothetical protein C8K38_1056 [Rhodococcus sp. OK611]SNX90233.1 hypothetical protein SAMN05447004_1056 [Rhodococcus sp. OK270]
MDLLSKTVDSLWQVVAVGLLLGAGLPAIFALGLRALDSGSTTDPAAATTTRKPAAVIAAGTCFAVVVVAIITGILFVMQGFLSHTFGIEIF